MIILDASAVVELVVEATTTTRALRGRLRLIRTLRLRTWWMRRRPTRSGGSSFPESWISRVLSGRSDASSSCGLVRWQQTQLLDRALALRNQLTAYDAIYVAMAGATLLTRDARLARAAGHWARVELV